VRKSNVKVSIDSLKFTYQTRENFEWQFWLLNYAGCHSNVSSKATIQCHQQFLIIHLYWLVLNCVVLFFLSGKEVLLISTWPLNPSATIFKRAFFLSFILYFSLDFKNWTFTPKSNSHHPSKRKKVQLNFLGNFVSLTLSLGEEKTNKEWGNISKRNSEFFAV